jgi:hypothetical protein
MCQYTAAGSAAAAEQIGYPLIAALIIEQELGPDQIARLFTLSASKQAGRDAAVIILAGSIARYWAEPASWRGTHERELARDALARDLDLHRNVTDRLLGKLSEQAVELLNGAPCTPIG